MAVVVPVSRDQTLLWAMSCTWILQLALLGQANLSPSLRARELLCHVTVSDANVSSEGSGSSRVAWASQPAPRPASFLGERSLGAQWGLSPGPCSALPLWEGAQWCKGSLGHALPGACSAELAGLAEMNATGAELGEDLAQGVAPRAPVHPGGLFPTASCPLPASSPGTGTLAG